MGENTTRIRNKFGEDIITRTFGSLYFDGRPVDVGAPYNSQELTIGDGAPGKEITWVYVNEMYVADHCLCININWNQLDEMELVFGKEVTIDGNRYLCRLLKMGAAPEEPNEWDAVLDATTEDDRLWHCKHTIFWGQETIKDWPMARAARGWMSARRWTCAGAVHRNVSVGFRPALIPLDAEKGSALI